MTVTGQNTSPLPSARQVRPWRVSFCEEHRSVHYTSEVLDRATGDLKEVSLGDWITVTELGERYSVGRRKVRSILHHMGLLQSEGQHGRYRLSPKAVEQGLGIRHDNPRRSKYPFDVISPEGQRLIESIWDETVADLERERLDDPLVRSANAALQEFQALSHTTMTTQEEVCWLIIRFPDLTYQQIANLLGVQRPLVSRYANLQKRQINYRERQKASD